MRCRHAVITLGVLALLALGCTENRSRDVEEGIAPEVAGTGEADYDPEAHRKVLAYFRKLWAGNPADPEFEAKSLSEDLNFNTLNLAELVLQMCTELDLPVDNAIEFMSITTNPQGPPPEALLTRRVAMLAERFSEEERSHLLLSGTVGDRSEIRFPDKEFDSVEFLVAYCTVIEKWCREEGPWQFPAPAVQDPDAPPHMQTRHPDDIQHYRQRRAALGKPWEKDVRTAVIEQLAYELNFIKGREIAPEDIKLTTHLETDLKLDTLDFVELTMEFEDAYDGRLDLENLSDEEYDRVKTVEDLIQLIEAHLKPSPQENR